MRLVRVTLLPLLFCCASTVASAQSSLDASTAHIREAALADDTAWRVTESLTTEIGARPVGSPTMERARDWAIAKFRELGFTNIKVENFTTPAWHRIGFDRAEIVGPYPHHLEVLALGKSAPTPPGGLEAPIVLFHSYRELLAAPEGALKGKIAVVTERIARTQDLSGYGSTIMQRVMGPAEAAKRGAVGYLTRSLSTATSRLPHTGGARAGGIPAGALSTPDAELLEHMVERGKPVVIRLDFASELVPAAPAYNISAELPGTTDETVIIGGHLDSWDVGTGAVDDGCGIGIAVAAARLAVKDGGKPRRTIRVVMWGSEEQGGSSDAYAKARGAEASRMVVAGESDTGADRVFAVALPRGSAEHPAMRAFVNGLTPFGIVVRKTPAEDGGADIEGLIAAGVPTVEMTQDLTRYMDLHHSQDDTLDKIDRTQLAQNVAVWAMFLHDVAYSDVNFRALAAASKK